MRKNVKTAVSLLLFVIVCAGCGNAGQTQGNVINKSNAPTVNDVLKQQMDKENAKNAVTDSNTSASNNETKPEGTDAGEVNPDSQVSSAVNDNTDNTSVSAGNTATSNTDPDINAKASSDETGKADTEPDNAADIEIDYDNPDIDLTKMSATMAYAEMSNLFYNREKTKDYIGKVVKLSGTYAISDPDQYGETYHFIVYWDATACCQLGGEFVMKNEDDYPEVFSDLTVVGVYRAYIDPADGQEYVHIDACIPVNE
ncbi:MAG: hypothetical protein K5796_00345 [Lachnospiraceae bacterium]|nr:hypothetical protein [Lachnospiraceae bacterium]